jgi:hypothetical protein
MPGGRGVKYFFNFKKFSEFTHMGPVMGQQLIKGEIVSMSSNLREEGCPADLNQALIWLSTHRTFRQVSRTEVKQKDGILVSLAFERVSIVGNQVLPADIRRHT